MMPNEPTASRESIGWNAPWFIAQATYRTPGDESSAEIRAAQLAVCSDGLAIQGPDTDSLKSEFRERKGQGVHFSGPGLRKHAALWVEKLSPWLESQLANPARH